MRHTLASFVLLMLWLPPAAHAQPRRDALPDQSIWIRVQDAGFRHTGDVPDFEPYDFDTPLVGIGYERPGLQAEVAFGNATAPAGRVRILDVDASVGNAIPLGGREQPVAFEAPVRLGFVYRRVQERDAQSIGDFDVQMLALQAGLGLRTRTGRVRLHATALGGAGLATRNFDGTPGYGLMGTVQLEGRTRLSRRFGLMAGYRFRLRQWDLDTGLFEGVRQRELYDYRAHSHAVHVGLLF